MARAYSRGTARFVEAESSDESDSSEEEKEPVDGREGASAGAGGANVSCVLRQVMSGPCPTKSKKVDELLPHAKFCLEERLHKEYGSSDSFEEVVKKVITKSKCKGIVAFRTFLQERPCTCGTCNIVTWMFPEAHWRTLFGPSNPERRH